MYIQSKALSCKATLTFRYVTMVPSIVYVIARPIFRFLGRLSKANVARSQGNSFSEMIF